MSLHEVADQVQVGLVGDRKQNDGAVARDAVAPERRLILAIAGDDAGPRPPLRPRVENRAGEPGVELHVRLAGAQLVQEHLVAGPGQGEHAVDHAGVAAAVHVDFGGGPRGGHADEGVDVGGLPRLDAHAVPDCGDGIEHDAGAVRKGPGRVESRRIAHGPAAPDEGRPVGLEGKAAEHRAAGDGHGVEHPGRRLLGRPGAAGEEDGGLVGNRLRSEEKLVEGRMGSIRLAVEQHDLGEAGDLDGPRAPGQVRDGNRAQLHVVFRADGHGRAGQDLMDFRPKLGAALLENSLVPVECRGDGLVGGGPDVAGVHLVQIEEDPVAVPRGILAPAGERQALPPAEAAAAVGDHHVVAAVGEQVHFGGRRVGGLERPRGRLPFFILADFGGLRRGDGRAEARARQRDALLEQQLRRFQLGIRQEAPLHRFVVEGVIEGEQRHAAVVGHPRANEHERFARGRAQAGRRPVQGFVQPEAAEGAVRHQPLEIPGGRLRRHHQGHGARIGRNDQIVGQSSLHAQRGDAEGAVLVDLVRVDLVVARLGDAPGKAQSARVADLEADRALVGLVEQGALVRGHHQERHQVLEHRTAPGNQHGRPAAGNEPPAQVEPVLEGQVSARQAHVASQPAFRGQKVVVAGISLTRVKVEADGQQAAVLIVEEI